MCHFVDTVAALAGAEATTVKAVGVPGGELLLSTDVALAIGFANGSVATVSYGSDGHPSTEKERLEIVGRGRAAVTIDFRELVLDGKRVAVESGKGHVAEARAFRAALRAGDREVTRIALASSRLTLLAAADLSRFRRPRPEWDGGRPAVKCVGGCSCEARVRAGGDAPARPLPLVVAAPTDGVPALAWILERLGVPRSLGSVALKLNLCEYRMADSGATTSPDLVADLVDALRAHAPTLERIVLLEQDSSGTRAVDLFALLGFTDLAERKDLDCSTRRPPNGGSSTRSETCRWQFPSCSTTSTS